MLAGACAKAVLVLHVCWKGCILGGSLAHPELFAQHSAEGEVGMRSEHMVLCASQVPGWVVYICTLSCQVVGVDLRFKLSSQRKDWLGFKYAVVDRDMTS